MTMEAGRDSIYRPPASELARPTEGGENFGSVEQGLRGDFHFSIQEILSEAWELTRGSQGVILGAFAVDIVINVVTSIPSGLVEASGGSGTKQLLASGLEFFGTVITFPIFAGITLYAVMRAARDPAASYGTPFSCYDRLLAIFGLTVLQVVLVMLGTLFFIIPGLYLAVAYGLALPLLIEKDMGIWEALESSRKAVTHCWFRFFGLYLSIFVITIVGATLTLGIGLFWLVPMWMLCTGVAYRNIFGYEGARA